MALHPSIHLSLHPMCMDEVATFSSLIVTCNISGCKIGELVNEMGAYEISHQYDHTFLNGKYTLLRGL